MAPRVVVHLVPPGGGGGSLCRGWRSLLLSVGGFSIFPGDGCAVSPWGITPCVPGGFRSLVPPAKDSVSTVGECVLSGGARYRRPVAEGRHVFPGRKGENVTRQVVGGAIMQRGFLLFVVLYGVGPFSCRRWGLEGGEVEKEGVVLWQTSLLISRLALRQMAGWGA